MKKFKSRRNEFFRKQALDQPFEIQMERELRIIGHMAKQAPFTKRKILTMNDIKYWIEVRPVTKVPRLVGGVQGKPFKEFVGEVYANKTNVVFRSPEHPTERLARLDCEAFIEKIEMVISQKIPGCEKGWVA